LGGIAAVGVVLAGIVLIVEHVSWTNRPMFHNIFGKDDHSLVRTWIFLPPNMDAVGNAALVDEQLNVLAIFLVGGSAVEARRFFCPRSTPDGVVFPAEFGEDDLTFFVPRRPNTMMVFDASGKRREFLLAPGEAKRMFDRLGGDPVKGLLHDFREVAPKLHRGEETNELKPVIGKAANHE
jgi:hypothetical protein